MCCMICAFLCSNARTRWNVFIFLIFLFSIFLQKVNFSPRNNIVCRFKFRSSPIRKLGSDKCCLCTTTPKWKICWNKMVFIRFVRFIVKHISNLWFFHISFVVTRQIHLLMLFLFLFNEISSVTRARRVVFFWILFSKCEQINWNNEWTQ